MKFNLKSIFAAVLALAATACSQPAIDDLTGTFAEPTILDLEGAKAEIAVDKQEGFRFITVTLSGKDQVVVKFASKDYFLTPTTYEICNAADAKAGRYIQGVSTANGKAFTFGGITVENLAIDGITYTYKIASTVQTGENERVRFAWTGTINFEPDPEPVKLTQVFSASSNVANGTNSVTLNLGSAGVTSTYDAATWSTVYSGNGNFAAIDIYSADGYLHEGTYKACAAGGVIAEGEFGIGWDPGDLWGIGMIFENWGTCWWTVDGGNTSAQKITNGEIVVSKKGSKWVIEYNNYAANGIWFVFEGKIDELTAPSSEEPVINWHKLAISKNEGGCTDESNNPVSGFDRYDVYIYDGEGEAISIVAAFDLVVAEGSDIEGDYTVKAYPHEDHVAGNGWGIPAWNFYGGSRLADGENWNYINAESTFSVTKLGDGQYSFTSDNIIYQSSVDGSEPFTGSLEIYGTSGDIPSGGEGDNTPVYSMVAQKADAGSVTDESNTPVAGFDRWTVYLVEGEGEAMVLHAQFDLVLTEGTADLTGEYTVASYPHADHVAGNGWGIAAWNYYGGTLYHDEADNIIYVNPGSTVTISEDGGVYTFDVEGEFVGAADGSEPFTGSVKFKGQLAAE